MKDKLYHYAFELDRVYDGDTVYGWVDVGYEFTTYKKFRLLGIQAPEIRTKDLEEKEKGYEARDWLKAQVEAGEELIIHSVEKGSFGRWLAILYIDGRNINEEMIQKGYAVEYKR